MKDNNVKEKSIVVNYIMNTLLSMSSFIFPLITFPYASRILLPIGNGKITFATSVISYFNMFAQLGIPTYGVRVCSTVRNNRQQLTKVAHELLLINMVMNIFSYCCLFISVLFIKRLQTEKTLLFIISCTIFLTSIGMEWLYKALEQYTYITVRSLIFKIVSLIAMFLFVKQESDYLKYGFITIMASSFSNIFNFINVHKYIDLKPQGNYDLKRHLAPVAVFFAMSCATTVYTHLDSVMLGFLSTEEEVGFYHAAVRVKSLLVSIVTSLGAVILPRASVYIKEGKRNKFIEITKNSLHFVLLFSIPLAIYFIIFARPGILLLSGNMYEKSVIPMQIIMPTLVFIGLSNLFGIQILVPIGKEKIVLYSEIVGAICNIIINALLIPKFNSIGAAIGTLVAELVVVLYQWTYLYRNEQELLPRVEMKSIIISSFVSAICSSWIYYLKLGHFTKLVISAVLFFCIYATILVIKKDTFLLNILNIVRRRIVRKGE